MKRDCVLAYLSIFIAEVINAYGSPSGRNVHFTANWIIRSCIYVSDYLCSTNTTCTILPSCISFMELIDGLQKPLKPSVVQFLRSQECGFEKGYAKVCCFHLSQKLYVTQRPNKVYVNLFASVDQGQELQVNIGVKNTEITTRAVKNIHKSDKISNYMKLDPMRMYEELTMFDLIRKKKERLV